MTMPARVSDYLKAQQIPYSLVPHEASNSSMSTSFLAHIPLKNIAKAVILEDHEGHNLMAVLPADRKVDLMKLGEQLNRSFQLVKEEQVYKMFSDCEEGAVPTMARAYHIDACWDEVLNSMSDIYFEAGDHNTLVHLNHDGFIQLMQNTRHFYFSELPMQ